jgi:hypothetical protein
MGVFKRLYERGVDVADRLNNYQRKTDLLRGRLDAMTLVPQWQAGYERWSDGRPKTFCNLAVWYTLDDTLPVTKYGPFCEAYHKNLTPMFVDGNSFNVTHTTLDVAIVNIMGNDVKYVAPDTAQDLANRGIPVMGICSNPEHVVMVRPDSDTYIQKRGPLISQCGVKCGTFYTWSDWCFGEAWYHKRILWVVFDDRD